MRGTILSCPECGSTNVQSLEWRYVNTGLALTDGTGPERHHCPDCDENLKELAPLLGEVPDTAEQLVADLATSGLFEFVLEGHVIPDEIGDEWEYLQARLKALTED